MNTNDPTQKTSVVRFAILLSFIVNLVACGSQKTDTAQAQEPAKAVQTDPLIGTKINFMEHAVTAHNFENERSLPSSDSEFKIVTYGDLYCFPCWQSLFPWKTELQQFEQYDNVSFFAVIAASEVDFDKENEKVQFEFPVYLDKQSRFRRVNKIGTDPSRMTFLLNKDNEILLVGPPFTKEMRHKYKEVITGL